MTGGRSPVRSALSPAHGSPSRKDHQRGSTGAASADEVTVLNLSGQSLAPGELGQLCSSLSSLRALVYLDLSATGVTDALCLQLFNSLLSCPHLKVLLLGGNVIRNDGASMIAQLLFHSTSLQHVSLRHNCIGDEGAQAIADALHSNGVLRSLDLADNNISASGGKALGTSIRLARHLRELDLSFNPVSDETVIALAEGLLRGASLVRLSLECCELTARSAIVLGAAFQKARDPLRLQSLCLSGNPGISSEGVVALAAGSRRCGTLKVIELVDTSVDANVQAFLEESGRRDERCFVFRIAEPLSSALRLSLPSLEATARAILNVHDSTSPSRSPSPQKKILDDLRKQRNGSAGGPVAAKTIGHSGVPEVSVSLHPESDRKARKKSPKPPARTFTTGYRARHARSAGPPSSTTSPMPTAGPFRENPLRRSQIAAKKRFSQSHSETRRSHSPGNKYQKSPTHETVFNARRAGNKYNKEAVEDGDGVRNVFVRLNFPEIARAGERERERESERDGESVSVPISISPPEEEEELIHTDEEKQRETEKRRVQQRERESSQPSRSSSKSPPRKDKSASSRSGFSDAATSKSKPQTKKAAQLLALRSASASVQRREAAVLSELATTLTPSVSPPASSPSLSPPLSPTSPSRSRALSHATLATHGAELKRHHRTRSMSERAQSAGTAILRTGQGSQPLGLSLSLSVSQGHSRTQSGGSGGGSLHISPQNVGGSAQQSPVGFGGTAVTATGVSGSRSGSVHRRTLSSEGLLGSPQHPQHGVHSYSASASVSGGSVVSASGASTPMMAVPLDLDGEGERESDDDAEHTAGSLLDMTVARKSPSTQLPHSPSKGTMTSTPTASATSVERRNRFQQTTTTSASSTARSSARGLPTLSTSDASITTVDTRDPGDIDGAAKGNGGGSRELELRTMARQSAQLLPVSLKGPALGPVVGPADRKGGRTASASLAWDPIRAIGSEVSRRNSSMGTFELLGLNDAGADLRADPVMATSADEGSVPQPAKGNATLLRGIFEVLQGTNGTGAGDEDDDSSEITTLINRELESTGSKVPNVSLWSPPGFSSSVKTSRTASPTPSHSRDGQSNAGSGDGEDDDGDAGPRQSDSDEKRPEERRHPSGSMQSNASSTMSSVSTSAKPPAGTSASAPASTSTPPESGSASLFPPLKPATGHRSSLGRSASIASAVSGTPSSVERRPGVMRKRMSTVLLDVEKARQNVPTLSEFQEQHRQISAAMQVGDSASEKETEGESAQEGEGEGEKKAAADRRNRLQQSASIVSHPGASLRDPIRVADVCLKANAKLKKFIKSNILLFPAKFAASDKVFVSLSSTSIVVRAKKSDEVLKTINYDPAIKVLVDPNSKKGITISVPGVTSISLQMKGRDMFKSALDAILAAV